jgi:hypothetical protein
MKLIYVAALTSLINCFALDQFTSSKACQNCHPVIYQEHTSSMHRNSSVFNDPIHKAVWDKHPLNKKESYKCAKCHTPNDKELINKLSKNQKAMPIQNRAQLKEGVSCVSCHNIKSIQKHDKTNTNIITKDKKVLYSARESEKGTKDKTYKHKSSFFGLITEQSGSPYHDIDFSNELYYNGNICIGCHSHKENAHKFKVCDMDLDKNPNTNQQNCISCHMPKVEGSFTTLLDSKTHRYHGFTGSMHKPKMLAMYVDLSINKEENGFNVTIASKVNHDLLLHPLRVGELRVEIIRDTKTIQLQPVQFIKAIGTNNKPSVPWLADEVVKHTQIKANETRVVHFDEKLQSNDNVIVTLGQYILNPKAAKKLDLQDNKELSKFRIFKQEQFNVK